MCLHKYDQTNLFLSEKYSDNCLYSVLRSFSFKLPRTLRGTVSNVPSDTSSHTFCAERKREKKQQQIIIIIDIDVDADDLWHCANVTIA